MFAKLMQKLPTGYYLSCIFWPLRPVPKCSPQGLESLLALLLLRLLQCLINFLYSADTWIFTLSPRSFSVLLQHRHEKVMIHPSYSSATFTILSSLSKAQAKTLLLRITQCLPGFQIDGLFWLLLFPVRSHRALPVV